MKVAFWIIVALLVVFILIPVLMLFQASVVGERPVAHDELVQEIRSLLVHVPEGDQAAWQKEWFDRFTAQDKLEVYSLALQDVGLADRFSLQGLDPAGVEVNMQKLSSAELKSFQDALRQEIFNKKRAVFMFRLKPFVPEQDFERLRSGKVQVFTWEHYIKVFTTSYLWSSITRSLKIAFISTIFTVAAAFLFAYVVNRTTCRFKSFFNAMMLLPLVSPPVIMAFALIMLFGRNGIVTNGLLDKTLHLIHAEATNIYGLHGIVLAQLLTYGPVAYVVLHSVLAQLDTRIEEAAENLGATRWDVFWKVTLPMSAPGLFQAALLIFALCLQDFGNPRVIGGEVTMIAGVMYDQMIAFQNTNVASVLGIILIVPSLSVFVAGNIYLAKKTFSTKEPGGSTYVAETPRLARHLFEIACLAVSILIVAMYGTIIWGSAVKIWGQDNTLTLAYYTSKGISSAGSLEGDVGSLLGFPLILASVKTMGIAGLIGGFLAVAVGYVLSRTRSLFSTFSDFLIMLTVALPGVVFGIGYILAFNKPLGLPQLSLLGSLWIIILLVMFTRLYGGVTPTQAVLQKVDETVEEAATSLGASRFYTFRRVVFPTLRRPWLLGSLYIFVSGLVALGGVIFLTSAKFPLASVQIYILAEQGKYGLACSHSVYLIVVVLAAQLLIQYLEKQGNYAKSLVGARA